MPIWLNHTTCHNLFASSFEDALDSNLPGQMDSNLDDSLDEETDVIESSKNILLDLCLIPAELHSKIYTSKLANRMSATLQKQTFDSMMNGGTYSTILDKKQQHTVVGFSCSINSLVGLIYRKSSGEMQTY